MAVADDIVDLAAASLAEDLMAMNKALKDLQRGGYDDIYD